MDFYDIRQTIELVKNNQIAEELDYRGLAGDLGSDDAEIIQVRRDVEVDVVSGGHSSFRGIPALKNFSRGRGENVPFFIVEAGTMCLQVNLEDYRDAKDIYGYDDDIGYWMAIARDADKIADVSKTVKRL